MRENVTPGETPEKITVSMIHEDLNNGITKPEMAIKYGIKSWEVAEMFKHPFLKGRRPSKKKPLSFEFVDDTEPLNSGDIAVEQAAEMEEEVITDEPIIDPNQVTLEDAIDEAIESVGEIKNQMQQTQEAIVDMLSPTDPEQTIESLINEVEDTEDEEEELEMDDDEFEL